MNKKALPILLILALTFNFIPAFAVGFMDVDEDEPYLEVVNTLDALGIISSVDEPLFRAEESMTKGEFTDIIVNNLLKIDTFGQAIPQIFNDLPASNKHAASVYTAYRMGLVTGHSDMSYGASYPITLGEGATILVNALGYKIRAQAYGGYPSGYIMQANTLRLLANVKAGVSDKLSRLDVAYMLYNSLETDLSELDYLQGDSSSYSITKGRNILTEYLKLNVVKGVVNRISSTSLTDPKLALPKGEIHINGVSYRVGSTNAADLFGYNVKAYYSQPEVSDNKVLTYVHKYQNNEITINPMYVEDYVDFTLRYTIDEFDFTERKLKLSNTIDFILNGKAWETPPASGSLSEYGSITVIDNDYDDKYDIVIVTSYEDYVVSSVNVKDTIIYSKTADTRGSMKLDLSAIDEQDLKLFDAEGEPLLLNSLKEDDVLSVKLSEDQKIAEILVSSEKIVGTVTEKSEHNEAEIDHLTRAIAPAFRGDFADISAGFSGTFYIDVFGGIAGVVTKDDMNIKYGYLAGISEPKSLADSVKVKLFTSEGIMLTVDVSDKIILDNQTGKTPDDLLAKFVGSSPAGDYVKMQLVKYRLGIGDALKEIAEIDKKNIVSVPDDITWRSDSLSFGSVVLTSANTSWFVVPKVETGRETELNGAPDTSFSGSANLSNNVRYSGIYAYDVDEGGVAAAIVRETPYSSIYPVGGLAGNAPAISDAYVMVDKITQTIDADGEVTPKLYFIERGTIMSYPAKNENILKKYQYVIDGSGNYLYRNSAEDDTILTVDETSIPVYLERGDIIQYRINDAQEIVGIKIIWDISRETSGYEKTVPLKADGRFDGRKEYPYKHMMRSGEERGYVYGTVMTQKNGFIGVLARGINDAEDIFNLYYYNAKAAPVMVYDVAKNEVYKGSFGDIEDEATAGSGSKVFIHNRWYSSYEVFIFKNLIELP